MAGFLVKRIVVMSFLAVAFTGTDISWLNSTIGALMPIEGYLREKSQEVATYNFPEHRWSYTAQELHTFFTSLGFDNLRVYLVYQFSDLFKTFIFTLFWLDLMTYTLSSSPSLASLDTLPFVYGAVGVAENFMLFYLAVRWPTKDPRVAAFASLCTAFKHTLAYIIFSLIGLGLILVLLNKLRGGQPTAEAKTKAKKD